MTVADLKKILDAVPDDFEVVNGTNKASVKITPHAKTVAVV